MAGGFVGGLMAFLYVGWLVKRLGCRGHGGSGRGSRGKGGGWGGSFGRADWIGPFRDWIAWPPVRHWLEPALRRPRMWLAALGGGLCPPERLWHWAAETAAIAYGSAALAWLLAAASGSSAAGWVGTAVALMTPALRARDLRRKVEARKNAVLRELPVVLSRLAILVNAGENVRRALARVLEGNRKASHPLHDELRAALAAMDRGESMQTAMEEFGRRCGVPEAQLFSAVLVMNMKRGGDALVPALQELTRQLWEKRKAAARTLGEQASSRLTFPLAVIFLVIMTLTGAPALMAL